MKTIHIGLNNQPCFEEGLSLAVGYFDGFHLGHQELIKKAKEKARENNLKTAVLSFDPNPLVTLGKMKEEKYLTSLKDREAILETMEIDYFLILDFTLEVANMLPGDFVSTFIEKMNVKEVICGFDFFFGQKGKGNGELLKTYTTFNTSVINQVSKDNLKISTTRINGLLAQGKLDEVTELLTRPYQMTGKVIHGKQRGRQMGFPTANIDYGSYYLPKRGVYGVKVIFDGDTYLGMCNVGFNPTFKNDEQYSVEVHLFDFSGDIYGEEISIQFYFYTRDEKTFSSKDELKLQLMKDQEEIRAYFA